MLKAEPSSSDSSSDTASSSDISSCDSDRDSDSPDDSRDRRSYRRSSIPRRESGGISPAADEMTVGRHLLRSVTIGTRHAADAMIVGPHLALAGTTIDATTDEAVLAVIVASHTPAWRIVGATTRSRGATS